MMFYLSIDTDRDSIYILQNKKYIFYVHFTYRSTATNNYMKVNSYKFITKRE